MNQKIYEIESLEIYDFEYTICTLVTDKELYEKMLESCGKAGFNETNTQFIYVDNTKNKYNAYQAINKFVKFSRGRYTILCHQDIEMLYDDKRILDIKIDELNKLDTYWGIAGNAGGSDLGELVIRISDPHGVDTKKGVFPSRVMSLDENFLILNNQYSLAISANLEGFHFYGTDLCLLASIQGLSSYVIDFHLLHKGKGTCDVVFYEQKRMFILKYTLALKDKIIQTTCTTLFLSGSKIKNVFYPLKLIRKFKRIKQKFLI